jgi:hypothetical protein|uniref:DNA-directed RNA polymerase subunit omega n=1 Tax=candidate division WOR-3 bacterium TaxID=2052148 RepID=A0A7C3YS47_UNCW3
MKDISDIAPEKIWRKFENRYEVIIRTARLVRKLLEEQKEGRFSPPPTESGDPANIFIYALKRILAEGKKKDEKEK